MAVRWRSRRPAPDPTDDGRWGVARLVAQREADRLARERGDRSAGSAVERAGPGAPRPASGVERPPRAEGSGPGGRPAAVDRDAAGEPAVAERPSVAEQPSVEEEPAGAGELAVATEPVADGAPEAASPRAGEADIDGPTQRTLTAVRRRRPGPAAIPTPDEPRTTTGADGPDSADGTDGADDSVPGPRRPVTPAPSSPVPPAPRRSPTGPVPRLPAPRRPGATSPGVVYRPPAVSARPPVDLDEGLLGFSRLTRGRVGARAFTLVFVLIYLVILVQTLSTIV